PCTHVTIFLSTSSFTAPPPPALHTLSLHDALPIFSTGRVTVRPAVPAPETTIGTSRSAGVSPPCSAIFDFLLVYTTPGWAMPMRSEEHTSELQSRSDLVCRLLLEKKKKETKKHNKR